MTNSTFCYLTIGAFALALVIALFYIVKWVKTVMNCISVSTHKGEVGTSRLHRSVLLLMEQMMRAYGGHDIELEKLAVIGNYINLTSTDEKQRTESFEMLKKTVRKNGKSDVCIRVNKYIDSLKNERLASTGKHCLAHGLKGTVNAPIDRLDTQGFWTNLKCDEVAEVLSTRLNPFQRKYLVYLLLHMAMTENSLSRKAEKTLKATCVNSLKLPENEFEDLCNATRNNQLDDWFQQNIQAAQPNTALHSDDLLNIFADEGKGNEEHDAKLSLSQLCKAVCWLPALQVIIPLGSLGNTPELVSLICFMVGMTAIVLISLNLWVSSTISHIPYYETYGTLFLPSDTKKCIKGLATHAAVILFTIVIFIIYLPVDFYHFADKHYAGKEVEVKTVICKKEKRTSSSSSRRGYRYTSTSYFFYYPPISVDTIPYTPEEPLRPMDEHLLSALDKSTLFFFKICDNEIFSKDVSKETFDRYNEKDTITLVLTKGGYCKRFIHKKIR